MWLRQSNMSCWARVMNCSGLMMMNEGALPDGRATAPCRSRTQQPDGLANILRNLWLRKTGAKLSCQYTHVGFFDDVEVGAGDFVDFYPASGQLAPAFHEIN